MTTAERWLPVPGYEGLYEVSDHGRVKRLRRVNRVKSDHFGGTHERQLQNQILKGQPCGRSAFVTLWRDRERWQVSIARLVREVFGA